MLEHVALAEHLAEYGGILLDDGSVRHRVDHAAHAVAFGERMTQREAHRRVRLAAARRHREREHARVLLGRAGAGVEQVAPHLVELGLRRVERRDLCLKALAQHVKPLGGKLLARAALHEPLGAEEVRIHQAGEHHPRQECKRKAVVSIRRRTEREFARNRQFHLVGEPTIIRQQTFTRALHASQQSRRVAHVNLRAPVGQPAVMPCHAICQHLRIQAVEQLVRTRRRMVHLMPAAQYAILKLCRVFPDVMGHPRRVRPALRAEGSREIGRHLRHFPQVTGNSLNPSVLCNMGHIFALLPSHIVHILHRALYSLDYSWLHILKIAHANNSTIPVAGQSN